MYNINKLQPPLNLYLYLLKKEDRKFFINYLKWIYLLSLRGLRLKAVSCDFFNNMYKAVYKNNLPSNTLIRKLQEEFIKRNLSLSLLLEPIDGFSWIAKNYYVLDYTKAQTMFLQVISPISRMVAVLNNCHPPFYQPFSSLILVYFSLYLKKSNKLIKIFKNNRIDTNIKLIDKQLPHLFNEAKYVIPTSLGVLFKLKLGFYTGLCHLLIKKEINKLRKIDYVNSFLYGLYYILTIKNKKIVINQI